MKLSQDTSFTISWFTKHGNVAQELSIKWSHVTMRTLNKEGNAEVNMLISYKAPTEERERISISEASVKCLYVSQHIKLSITLSSSENSPNDISRWNQRFWGLCMSLNGQNISIIWCVLFWKSVNPKRSWSCILFSRWFNISIFPYPFEERELW